MKLAGFNFTRISAEKYLFKEGDLKIDTNLDLKDIKAISSEMIKFKEEFINIKFLYSLNYSPKYAQIEFEGEIIVSLEPNEAKEVLKGWKDKKLDISFKEAVFNLILKKCNIKALQLEEELSIPIHFKLPSIKFEQKDKN